MNSSRLASIEDIQAFVRDSPKIHIIGSGSKTGLHGPAKDSAVADMTSLRGIVKYLPEEYTLTVRAGTPVREIQAELRKMGNTCPLIPSILRGPRLAAPSPATFPARVAFVMVARAILSLARP